MTNFGIVPKSKANPKAPEWSSTVEARKLEHGFRRISARIPYILPLRHEDNDVPTFWLLLYSNLNNDPHYSNPYSLQIDSYSEPPLQ